MLVAGKANSPGFSIINSSFVGPKGCQQDCFKELGYKEGDLPVAERLCNEVLSLPVYPEPTAEQIEIEYVAKTVLKFYELGNAGE